MSLVVIYSIAFAMRNLALEHHIFAKSKINIFLTLYNLV